MKNKTDNEKYIINPQDEFAKYMKRTLKSKKMKKRDVFCMADIPISYGYKILLGEKKTKQRDILIRICFVANFTVKELQEALKLYEMPELYKKILRDKIILETFASDNRDIDVVNEKLKKNNLLPLKECGEDY